MGQQGLSNITGLELLCGVNEYYISEIMISSQEDNRTFDIQ